MKLIKDYYMNFKYAKTKTKVRSLYKILAKKILSLDSPLIMMISSTYRCQCNCVHCCVGSYKTNKEQELSTNQIKKIIDEAYRFGVIKVIFFGGEPALRQDLKNLIRYCSKKGLITQLESNGIGLTRKKVEEIKKAGISCISISLDSPNPAKHDFLRKYPGCFNKAVEAIGNAVKESIPCVISTYFSKENMNYGELRELINLGKKLKVDQIRLLFSTPSGRWINKDNLILSDSEKKSIIKNFVDYKFVTRHKHCTVTSKNMVYISPYGDVQPCCFIPIRFGNIQKEDLRSIWHRMTQSRIYKADSKKCIMEDKNFRMKMIRYFNENNKGIMDYPNLENE